MEDWKTKMHHVLGKYSQEHADKYKYRHSDWMWIGNMGTFSDCQIWAEWLLKNDPKAEYRIVELKVDKFIVPSGSPDIVVDDGNSEM